MPYAGATVPEIDAGYVTPTPLDTGHGGFTDGLFTKPPIGSYPAYLNKSEFCAEAIAANRSCGTIQYKSGTHAYIESQGYDIIANFGDQFSDLEGGYADKSSRCPTRTTTSRSAALGVRHAEVGDGLRAWPLPPPPRTSLGADGHPAAPREFRRGRMSAPSARLGTSPLPGRSGSIKRCATAVGEGAMVVRFVRERFSADVVESPAGRGS